MKATSKSQDMAFIALMIRLKFDNELKTHIMKEIHHQIRLQIKLQSRERIDLPIRRLYES